MDNNTKTGDIFGYWTVQDVAVKRNRHYFVPCKCVCGIERLVNRHNLVSGISKSCGCENRKRLVKAATKHGMKRSPEFSVWMGMRVRCRNPKNPSWKDYGGRGIKVCEEWDKDFLAFYNHVGPRPSPKHSIERNDTNGNYEPGNVRWATNIEQQNNMRRNHRLTFNGETHSIYEWAGITGISYSAIYQRIHNGKWPVTLALTIPSSHGHVKAIRDDLAKNRLGGRNRTWEHPKPNLARRLEPVSFNGKTHTIKEWAYITGIPYNALHGRLAIRKWPVERALTEPLNKGK